MGFAALNPSYTYPQNLSTLIHLAASISAASAVTT
jgi:hypothetical protein